MAIEPMRIQDLPVVTGAKITEVMRKHLLELLVRELAAKRSLLHVQFEQREREVIERYQKEVGYEGIQEQLIQHRASAKAKETALEQSILEMGLMEDGQPLNPAVYGYSKCSPKVRKAAERVERLLKAIRENAPDASFQTKLEARLLIAQTVGEAVVILREVMGNGVLPSIPKGTLLTYTGS